MASGWEWEDMVQEFRALGGVIDNVRPGRGSRGKGLFVVDATKEACVHVPKHLLINADDVELKDGSLRIRATAEVPPEVRSFFRRFQEHFSFGAGAREDGWRRLKSLHSLPETIQDFVLAHKPSHEQRFPKPTDERLLRWFLETRSAMLEVPKTAKSAGLKHHYVLMPVIEMINHSNEHGHFKGGVEFFEVSGTFENEVLVSYNMKDTWQKYVLWGFVSDEPVAYSMALKVSDPSGRIIQIGRDLLSFVEAQGLAIPKVTSETDIAVSHLVLGLRKAPQLPRHLFRLAMENADIDVDPLFDVISHINRTWFYRLLETLEGYDGAAVRELRRAALLQLQNLSFAFGAMPRQG